MSEREQLISIFQRVSTHLLTQMRQARAAEDDGTEFCRYRMTLEDGTVLRCAVGCLIPDRAYDPLIEGISLYVLHIDGGSRWTDFGVDPASGVLARVMNESGVHPTKGVEAMLRRLQDIHDITSPVTWYQGLTILALDLSLDPPMLPTPIAME